MLIRVEKKVPHSMSIIICFAATTQNQKIHKPYVSKDVWNAIYKYKETRELGL